jgi:hypothetical protein
LRDDLLRSHLRINATIELGADLSKFAAFAGDARWADGKLHFVCSGYLQSPSCRADREGRQNSRSLTRSPGVPSTIPEPLDPSGMPIDQLDDNGARRTPRTDDVRDRLRKRREEREAARGAAAIPATDEQPVPVDEPVNIDEQPIDVDPSTLPDDGGEEQSPPPEDEQ